MRELQMTEQSSVSGGFYIDETDIASDNPFGFGDPDDPDAFGDDGQDGRAVVFGMLGNLAYDTAVNLAQFIATVPNAINSNATAISTSLPPLPGRGEGQSGGSNSSSWSGNG